MIESTDKDQKRLRRALVQPGGTEPVEDLCLRDCVCVLLNLSTPGEGWGGAGPV